MTFPSFSATLTLVLQFILGAVERAMPCVLVQVTVQRNQFQDPKNCKSGTPRFRFPGRGDPWTEANRTQRHRSGWGGSGLGEDHAAAHPLNEAINKLKKKRGNREHHAPTQESALILSVGIHKPEQSDPLTARGVAGSLLPNGL